MKAAFRRLCVEFRVSTATVSEALGCREVTFSTHQEELHDCMVHIRAHILDRL